MKILEGSWERLGPLVTTMGFREGRGATSGLVISFAGAVYQTKSFRVTRMVLNRLT